MMATKRIILTISGENKLEVEAIEQMLNDSIWDKLADEGASAMLDGDGEPQGITKLWDTTIEVTE
jgi:hypothetical protein